MVRFVSLANLYKNAARPFFFSFEVRKRIRLSGQIFAYDYNDIGRFHYVIVDIGLDNQVLYKVPDFLKTLSFLDKGFKLRYTSDNIFMLKPSFFSGMLFSNKFVGSFPLTFFNSYAIASDLGRGALDFQALAFSKALFKSGMGGVKIAVDSHLSVLFGIQEITFPKGNNYISTFSHLLPQVYLILGGHNISVYTSNSEGAHLAAKGLQRRNYKVSFFKRFFQGLHSFFLQQFFRPVSSSVSIKQLSFFFSYYQQFVFNVLLYFSYVKLYLNASVFYFFGGVFPSFFVSMKLFLVEFINLLFRGNQREAFSHAPRRWLFRNLVYKALRFFLIPNYSSVALALLAKSSTKKTVVSRFVVNDIAFLKRRGVPLSLCFSSSYKQIVLKHSFLKAKAKDQKEGPRVLCRKLKAFTPRGWRTPWRNRLHGYYRRKRTTKSLRWFFTRKFSSNFDFMLLRNYRRLSRQHQHSKAFLVPLFFDEALPQPLRSGVRAYFNFRAKRNFLVPSFGAFKGVRISDFRLPLTFLEMNFYKKVAKTQLLRSLRVFTKKKAPYFNKARRFQHHHHLRGNVRNFGNRRPQVVSLPRAKEKEVVVLPSVRDSFVKVGPSDVFDFDLDYDRVPKPRPRPRRFFFRNKKSKSLRKVKVVFLTARLVSFLVFFLGYLRAL